MQRNQGVNESCEACKATRVPTMVDAGGIPRATGNIHLCKKNHGRRPVAVVVVVRVLPAEARAQARNVAGHADAVVVEAAFVGTSAVDDCLPNGP